MTDNTRTPAVSIDWVSLLVALALAALVRAGVLEHVPW